jgi:type I restriction enzyme S subunit
LKNNINIFRDVASGMGSMPQISLKVTENFRVPVPPLEVQHEIVRILDNFTELTVKLTEELTAELIARKKQYEYYRDELLNQKKNIPMVTLKEISTSIYRGAGIKRDQVKEEGIPCVRYGEIYTTYNTWFDKCVSHTKEEYISSPKYFEYGDILFAITGESVEDIAKSIAYIGHEKCLAGSDIVVMKHKQNPRYLAHVLNTSMARQQKSKGKVKSKVVHSNVSSIEQIKIPLPSLEVQKRYADVLDNFEQICNDLNIALPTEIEARQKQYEYYRDLLLTFAETGDTILTDRQTDRQTDSN